MSYGNETTSIVRLPALFARFVKLEHSVFALPFAFAGAFLARNSIPPAATLLWITLAMVAARSLAMGLNRIIDREIDARNPRTAGRELPAGRLSAGQAYLFCGISLAALALALANLPRLTWYLSPIVVAAFVIYPYTKRFTSLCHVFLGATIGLAPVGAWVAVTGQLSWQPFLLMGVVTFWIGGFDIAYACLDLDFDRREGGHSLPVLLGVGRSLLVMRVFHVLAVALLAAEGLVRQRGAVYFAGVLVVAVLLAFENSLVSARNLSRIGIFMNLNGFIGIIYVFFLTVDLLVK